MSVSENQSEEGSSGSSNAPCSICLDPLTNNGERSIAILLCGHEFHLGNNFSFQLNSMDLYGFLFRF